jgi:2,3-dihydroxybenzoate decarboxylase
MDWRAPRPARHTLTRIIACQAGRSRVGAPTLAAVTAGHAADTKRRVLHKGSEMFDKPNCPVITIEEHYGDAELAKTYTGIEAGRPGPQMERLFDLGTLRLKEMDEAGIDIQVISHGAPSAQKLPPDGATALVRGVNDRLAAACAAHPGRLAAFAALPSNDPKAAADELERSVTRLGMKGAMMHGLSGSVFLDDKRFWPIYERAEALDVPIYFHPGLPDARVAEAYYNDYAKDFPMVVRAAWGYTVETATTAIRLVLSGVFEKHPKLKVILGHLGETLPFLVWRIDHAIGRPGAAKKISFRDIFCGNFWITTSGNFSTPALMCCIQELGVDRILFAVDWPFVMNPPGIEWMKTVPLCDEDKAKILSGNAKRLLRL